MAGIAADRERSYVMLLCAVSLVVPFLMLALSGAGASGIIIWAIGYLLFGFFTVFRILLFADFAAQDGRLWISAAGLLFGRIGDVLGTIICLRLPHHARACDDRALCYQCMATLHVVQAYLRFGS